MNPRTFLAALLLPALIAQAAEPDIVIADFEGPDYGAWKSSGGAMGTAPARGTLSKQMSVQGFAGKGLVNSFLGGDDATGSLVSPEFKISRGYLTFLIGGGGWEGETCMELIIDGQVMRTATGPNTKPGGTEALEPASWDLKEYAGQTGHLEILDARKGGWGHINVDQIVLTDVPPPSLLTGAQREIECDKHYLNLPVKTGAKKRRVTVTVGGAVVREFDIELADAEPDFWVALDLTPFRGKRATVTVDRLPEDSRALASLEVSDGLKGAENLYREPLRGQLHFSASRGWLNDPNGMVFAQGEYHLYFQLNPYGWHDAQKHWGHAVSRDLVHWEELPVALYPRRFGDDVWSGSAVVDKANTSGWKTGDNELLVAAFTSTGRGECIVYSNDRGRTWQEHAGNPVVAHIGRDPRLLWHTPTRQWVMCLYSEAEKKRWITFHTSPDLKTWTYTSRIEGFYECPDFFELPVDGDPAKSKWVLTGASSEYMVGTFDGKTFTPETPKLPGHRGRGFYAAQTFTNEPQGRVVQVGWLQTETKGMPFNQSMSIPLQLSLRETAEGPRLAWQPVAELAKLRAKSAKPPAFALADKEQRLDEISGELLEVRAEIQPGDAAEAGLRVRGIAVSYDARKQELSVGGHKAPAALRDGKLRVVIFADRTCLEVFANDGLTYVPLNTAPKPEDTSVVAFAKGGSADFRDVEVHELRSIWAK